MFVIHSDRIGGYVLKHDGINMVVDDPRDASGFFTEEEARNARPGHARSMGGDGFFGTVMPLQRAIRNYEAHRTAFGRYRL
jgi:hypothetical protein